jgi:stage V sporulation protein G
MEITEITVTLRNEDKLKAFVNVTFDDQFVVRGLKIIKSSNGFFISMPSRKMPDGSFRDIAHPINKEFRELIEKIILEKYHQQLKEEKSQGTDFAN